MANTVLMPQLGISEESAVLTQWHVREGDVVKAGQQLFSIETGKSAFDVESEHSGTVLKLLASEGDEIAVKAPVCVIGEQGEIVDIPAAASSASPITAPVIESAPAPTVAVRKPTADAVRGVSPRARVFAEKVGVDPLLAVPTGPEGRVIERDVRALANAEADVAPKTPRQTAAYEDKPLSSMRKLIAKNMMASLQNTAQLTHTASFDATDILAYRKRLKADPAMSGVTLTDMVLYAVTRTLPDFPSLNAHLLGDTLRIFSEVNLACAVDTERGLKVPVIFGASNMTLSELSQELKNLAEQCRSGSIRPDLLNGGSFTVSNLGQFGIESFTPILNAPQTGILGMNTITQRVRVVDGCIGAYPCMTLSLTYDHRALDGAPASKFLQTLCKNLEGFTCTI